MRYLQTREESAEILRAALTSMGQQSAAFHPPSYTIWYEHVAGINPELSRVLTERLAAGTPLTDADVARLHAQYVLARDTTAVEHIEERFRVLLEQVSSAATSAGNDASHFGSTLAEHTVRLTRPMAHEALQDMVAELLTDTRRMCVVTTELTKQLERSTGEIRALTARLEQAETEALRDPLTGLYNRRGFSRAVEESTGEAHDLTGAALLVIDVDHFKRVNDEYGHLLGDKALCAVARILRTKSAAEGIAARLGGEEFALFLPASSLEAAATVAERLRQAVAKLRLRRVGGEEYVGHITVSIGVARAGEREALDRLVQRSDAALYAAKRAGRDRVEVANDPEDDLERGQARLPL